MNVVKRIYRAITGKFEAAVTTPHDRERWKYADSKPIDDSIDYGRRKTMMSRARYECQNSSWLNGLLLDHAVNLVSTGAMLQIAGRPDANQIEQEFAAWARSVGLWRLLRTALVSEMRDGEAFIELVNRPQNANPCKLYPILVDSARVQDDAITYDECQSPTSYRLLKAHPEGDKASSDTIDVKANWICHLFRREYPEQHRGFPWIAPAIPQLAMLRSYTVATVSKMENAACLSGVLKPTSTEIEPQIVDADPFTEFSLPQRSWVTLPAGYDAQAWTMGTPTDSQSAFALEVKLECARCLMVPKNVVLGDSSSYNYSSARLDTQSYDETLDVQRQDIDEDCLSRIFSAWWRETHGGEALPVYTWYYGARPYINPLQEINAEIQRLASGTVTYQSLCAERGEDWQLVMRRRYEAEAYKRKLEEEFGFTVPLGVAFNNNNQGA